ncbi:hypothetical protein HMN09_00350700 [Mycena chlorophos]|uniref:Uncharacterized protein n=1 Tax=Mycena chlorophos TaxID=658473 RepID=A0A8H6TMJ7_MYCCL|nr:hypothetical protein HMN09_00350700 [Mycena chlorophos]
MSTAARPALERLPIELWLAIFADPDLKIELLKCATLCRTLNDLCIPLFFAAQGIPLDEDTPPIVEDDALHALALYAPGRQLTVKKLQYRVTSAETVLSEMQRLARLVARCPSLEELSLDSKHDDLVALERGSTPARGCLRILCRTLSALAGRIPAPVFVFSTDGISSAMHTCKSKDIARWRLECFAYAYPVALEDGENAPWKVLTQLHTGKTVRVRPITTVKSMTLRLLPVAEQAFTLLEFGTATLSHWSLQRCKKPMTPYFNLMLHHIVLPKLIELSVYSQGVDPVALRAFLVAHPKLKKIDYNGYNEWRSTAPNVFIDPPLAHSGLVQVTQRWYGFHPKNRIRLVPAFLASPQLHIIQFVIQAFDSPYRTESLIDDLRRIGGRDPKLHPLTLTFLFPEHRSHWLWHPLRYTHRNPAHNWIDHPDLPDIAQTLTNVRSIDVTVKSTHSGRRFLKFLEMMPAAMRDLKVHLHGPGHWEASQYPPFSDERADVVKARKLQAQGQWHNAALEFVTDIREALPNVRVQLLYN